MAKKKGGKVIQMPTPENYIRKRSRDLPIWECLVNADWEKSGMVNVVVARRHVNGNITYCLYMVDLLCLGVKDTLFSFNTPLLGYKEFVEKKMEHLEMVTVDYTLAHNIVYAAVEFAEGYGFKPHKDFIATTRYHLKEDNEEVELIDIDCGRNGKPLYFQGPFEDSQKVNQIIAQLDRTAGPGNYDYILAGDEGWDEGQEDDEYEWDEDDEYDQEAFEENREEFLSLISNSDNLSKKQAERLYELTEFFFEDLIDPEMVDEYYDEYSSILSSISILVDDVPDEFLGVEPGDPRASDKVKDMFIDLLNFRSNNRRKIQKKVEAFRKKAGDIPAVYFAELSLEEVGSTAFEEKLARYAGMFPNYPLIRTMYLTHQINKENDNIVIPMPENPFDLNFFFHGRKSIYEFELIYFLTFNAFITMKRKEPSKMEVIWQLLDEINIDNNKINPLYSTLSFNKFVYVLEYLKSDN